MRRLAILVALAACEPEDSGDGEAGGSGSGVTTAPAESSGGSESEGGSTGEVAPACLTPGGDACPLDAVCETWPAGSVCVEPCSQTGACKAGLECRSSESGYQLVSDAGGCIDPCTVTGDPSGALDDNCADPRVCTKDSLGQHGFCVWPEA